VGDWQSLAGAIEGFLDEGSGSVTSIAPPSVPGAREATGADGHGPEDTADLVGRIETVTLSRYWVVPGYVRFDEHVRETLKDARHQIVAGLSASAPTRENHLIWAPPGSGKTYFIQRVAAALGDSAAYRELNLAANSKDEFIAGLERVRQRCPALCFIDEIDARPDESWPYEMLLPLLDANTTESARIVVVLAGSGGADLAEMKARISARPKGADLLSRIPSANEYIVPPMGAGDRLLAALTQIRLAAADRGRPIDAVDKLALYYLVTQASLANPRQLREAVVRGVGRVTATDDRLKYDHLFAAGDPQNKSFWLASEIAAERLANRYVTVED